MELTETTWKWLAVGAVAGVLLLHRVISKRVERRRRIWVDSLATAFGTIARHGADATSHFEATVNGRRCEIAHGYRSRTIDGRYIRGYGLVITVPLHDVSEIYNLSFKRRGDQRSAESLSVRDNGYHPREGWLTEPLRNAIFDFYDSTGDREPLNFEGGALTYVTKERIGAEPFRRVVEHLLAVAAKLETAL